MVPGSRQVDDALEPRRRSVLVVSRAETGEEESSLSAGAASLVSEEQAKMAQ